MKPNLRIILLVIISFFYNAKSSAQVFEVDTSFHTGIGFDGLVRAIDVQSNGKVIVVGEFTSYNGNPSPGIARLNTDGSFDNTFISPISNIGPYISNVKIQPNGQILISGGRLYPIDSTLVFPGTVLYASFARLNTNGSFDYAFTENAYMATSGALGIPPGQSGDFVLQNDGTILFGFYDIGIIKLLNTGSGDVSSCAFPEIFTITHTAYLALPQTKIIVNDLLDILLYGYFDSLSVTGGYHHQVNSAIFNSGLCLQSNTHSIDTLVYSSLRIGTGEFLIGGSFTNYDGNAAYQVAKIDNNGNFDNTFSLSSQLNSTAVIAMDMAQSRLLMGIVNGYLSSTPLNNIAVFNLNGSIDNVSSSVLNPNGLVTSIKADTTHGYVYVGGDFLSFSGMSYPRITRLKNTPSTKVPVIASGDNINIYPNPAQTSLTVISPNPITTISISNLLGQIIDTHEYNSSQVLIDVSALPTGIYFIKVNGTEVKKFVKQ